MNGHLECEPRQRQQLLLERMSLEQVNGKFVGVRSAEAIRFPGHWRGWLSRIVTAIALLAPGRILVAGQPTWRSGAPWERLVARTGEDL